MIINQQVPSRTSSAQFRTLHQIYQAAQPAKAKNKINTTHSSKFNLQTRPTWSWLINLNKNINQGLRSIILIPLDSSLMGKMNNLTSIINLRILMWRTLALLMGKLWRKYKVMILSLLRLLRNWRWNIKLSQCHLHQPRRLCYLLRLLLRRKLRNKNLDKFTADGSTPLN